MKKYIILGDILNIGGGELYRRNKVDYLKRKGWKVEVYFGLSGELLIPELEEYQKNFYFELYSCPFLWTLGKRNQIIQEIVSKISVEYYDEIVVESNNLGYALWGELIAEQLGAKHVVFNVEDNFPQYTKWKYDFLDYKHRRKELAGVKPSSLSRMFGKYKHINEDEGYYLNFVCLNVTSDENNYRMEGIQKSDINLGCISRLDKTYVLPMVGYVAEVAKEYPEISFSLVIVGDASDPSISGKIMNTVKEIKNLKLHILGYLSPIPNRLIEYTDYFIGTSASACMTADAGKITVVVDTNTCQPIGIENYDTSNNIYADPNSKSKNLKVYLEQLIFAMDKDEIKKKIKENKKEIQKVRDYMVEFDKHMDFIDATCRDKQYFQFNNFSFLERVKFGICKLIGVKRWMPIKKFLLALR